MGFMNKIKSAVSKNPDKARQAIDKVADTADKRTGGKHASKIDQAAEKAQDFVDKSSGGTAGRRDPEPGRGPAGPTDPLGPTTPTP